MNFGASHNLVTFFAQAPMILRLFGIQKFFGRLNYLQI